MRPIRKIINGDSISLTFISADQTTAGAGAFLINGSQAVDGVWETSHGEGQQIGIESVGNISAVTFTVTGEDESGKAASEDITGPNATTVESSTYFSKITSITVDGAVGTNTSIGVVDEILTSIIPLDVQQSDFNVGISIYKISGSMNVSLELTNSDIYDQDATLYWNDWSEIDNVSSTFTNKSLTIPTTAIRLRFNTISAGSSVEFVVTQGRSH